MALKKFDVQPNGRGTRLTSAFTLESRQWTLSFYTNSVDDSWNYDLTNDSQEAVIRGEGITLGVSMFERFRALDMPPGEFFVVEQGEGIGGSHPDQDAFKEGRAALLYDEAG